MLQQYYQINSQEDNVGVTQGTDEENVGATQGNEEDNVVATEEENVTQETQPYEPEPAT